MFFVLGDGDVEHGVVFGGSVSVVFGSMVQDFAGWSWRLNHPLVQASVAQTVPVG